jgi:tetratricopeptide (TPR) repeat protein
MNLLAGVLSNRFFLNEAAESDLRRYWARIQRESGQRAADAYRNILAEPGRSHPALVAKVAQLLNDLGDVAASMALFEHLVMHYRNQGPENHLRACLNHLAIGHWQRGNLGKALDLFGELELSCHKSGDLAGLAGVLSGRALVFTVQGELDRALELHREEERLCRQLRDCAGLASCLCNQANLYRRRGDFEAAIALARESQNICRDRGDLAGA